MLEAVSLEAVALEADLEADLEPYQWNHAPCQVPLLERLVHVHLAGSGHARIVHA
jgi:hypothetical protein